MVTALTLAKPPQLYVTKKTASMACSKLDYYTETQHQTGSNLFLPIWAENGGGIVRAYPSVCDRSWMQSRELEGRKAKSNQKGK
jgi:hypothetical protein